MAGSRVGFKGSEWARFWSKVRVVESGCWEWQHSSVSGYGQFRPAGNGKLVLAHRWAYEKCIGPIPAGLELDHLCRNRSCVNPLHLEAVTRRTNLMRSPFTWPRIHADKAVCKRGHPLSGENLRLSHLGHRICKACRKIHRRKQKQKTERTHNE